MSEKPLLKLVRVDGSEPLIPLGALRSDEREIADLRAHFVGLATDAMVELSVGLVVRGKIDITAPGARAKLLARAWRIVSTAVIEAGEIVDKRTQTVIAKAEGK